MTPAAERWRVQSYDGFRVTHTTTFASESAARNYYDVLSVGEVTLQVRHAGEHRYHVVDRKPLTEVERRYRAVDEPAPLAPRPVDEPVSRFLPDRDLGEWRTVGRFSLRLEYSAAYALYRVGIRHDETGVEASVESDGYTNRPDAGAAYWATFKAFQAIVRLTGEVRS